MLNLKEQRYREGVLMICYKCQFENKGGDKICSKCGALLDYHEIDAKKIDISGLALEEEDNASDVTTSSKGIGGKLVILFVLVVAGVAAAIFIPKYLSEARAGVILEAITAARSGVETYVREHRVWPASESDIKPVLTETLKSEITIVIKKGIIELSIKEEPGKKATISPSVVQGRVKWRCENGGIGQQYLPPGCFQ